MLALATLCAFAASVAAVPNWQGFSSRSSVGALVKDANALEAVGLPYSKRFFLDTDGGPGEDCNATITEHSFERLPPLYFLNNDRLYHWTNESYIQPVVVLNSTESDIDPMPYKLVVGGRHEREGVQGTSWSWRGPHLYVDHPASQRSNLGAFYSCRNKHGVYGTYLHLQDGALLEGRMPERSRAPHGCFLVHLLDYTSITEAEEEKKQQAVLQSWW